MSNLNVAKVEALLDELIDADPDKAERFISERLARVELRKRLQQKKEATMTLLERFTLDKYIATSNHADEIRRALAIAQAVEECVGSPRLELRQAALAQLLRAEELLEGK